MVIREKSEMVETLKAENFPEKTIIGQFVITAFKDVPTKFGDKIVAELEKEGKKTSAFVNNISLGLLIDAFGKEDTAYIGKIVNVSCEKDEYFNKKMIKISPVA